MSQMDLAITIDLMDAENGERWTRSRAYKVPRGLHIGRLMDDLDDTVQDARRIVENKQRQRREEELERISQEARLHEASHKETEGAEGPVNNEVTFGGDR